MGFISNMYRAALGDNGLKELQRCLPTKSTKGAKKRSVLIIDDEITDDDSGTEFDDETNQERIMNHVRIYFPSYETVRLSKKGFNSGGTICFNSSWWDSPSFPRSVMRDCVSVRDGLLMHNKVSVFLLIYEKQKPTRVLFCRCCLPAPRDNYRLPRERSMLGHMWVLPT